MSSPSSLAAPSAESFGEVTSHADPNISPRDAIVLSLEGVALQNGILPVQLLREGISPEAEQAVRKLGRVPQVSDPWLPVSTIGPLVVMAHHYPKAADFWGIPSCFVLKVLISADQYQKTRRELVQRFGSNPIPQQSNYEGLKAPKFSDLGMDGTFNWFLENYPFSASEESKLRQFRDSLVQKNGEKLGVADYNTIMRNLGVVLQHLVSQGRTLVYNAKEAPKQSLFPVMLLERHNVYPLYVGKQVVYLLTETTDCYAFEDEWLSMGSTPLKIITVLSDGVSIREAITRASAQLSAAAMGVSATAASGQQLSISYDTENVIDIAAEDMARVNPTNPNEEPEALIQWALFTAIRCRASDLHIEKYYNVVRCRARIDGNLKTILAAPEALLPRFVALIKNYSSMAQTRQEAQDGRFALSIGQRRVDVRVAAVPTRRDFQKVIMRFLDKQDGVRRLSDFNLSQRQLDILTRSMSRDQGLLLVTGPTGSGKTTTLYALLNSVNSEDINIQTIEDPIEYEIEGINQTQTNHSHNLSFATGLRALLRADPDIILIGESRDAETANAAINASLTGHLVLTTLHANDSLRAISRLLSMGVEKYLVADSLALSQAQRLVRRLCSYCKRPEQPSQELVDHFASQGILTQQFTQPIYTKAGCDECHGTGYSGRVALMELCEVTTELRDLVEEGAPMSAMRAVAFKGGFLSLYQEGLLQVMAGHTTMEEIRCLSYTAI
jgi:type II secretory ATPase GspE/PulE/Tfp pilus assembly ATPase PilB-like protein